MVAADDSDIDKCDDMFYPNLYIVHIIINKKNWINPCINYNIGFNYAECDNVVISNAEVCVFGNIYEKILPPSTPL